MSHSRHERVEQAASGNSEQILALLHDPSPQVIAALLGNRNLSEDDVLVIASRKNLPPEIFTTIFRDHRWSDSYPVRRALALNPKTPLSISISIARYLRLFDLAEISRSPHIPSVLRNKIESIIAEKIPSMALGLKKSLAKLAVGNVLLKLLQDHDAEVISLCLNNPRLRESHLYKIISRKDTAAATVRMIAGHPNWANHPSVRFALVRNEHTPLHDSDRFLQGMLLQELRELYTDRSLPKSARPLVYRELLSRGQDPGTRQEEVIYEIDDDEDNELDSYDEDETSENRGN